MRALISTALIAIVLALGVAGPGHAQAAGTHALPQAQCAIQYIVGTETCYAPAQVAQAERSAAFAIRPSAVVARILRLSLAQVSVWRSGGTAGQPSIDYLYGVLRHDYGRAPGEPVSLRLTETSGRYTHWQARYTRYVQGVPFEISQAALDHPYRPYGPWYLIGNFAHHNASFAITANEPQDRLIKLALALHRAG